VTGASTYVHQLDAPIVLGERPPPPAIRPNAVTKTIERLGERRGLTTAPPAPISRRIGDGDELPFAGGLRVRHTPGHTPGHVSLLRGSKRVLFAGDAVGALLGRLAPPLGAYTEDMEQAKASIRTLAALDFDAVCVGHGHSISGGANVKFRELVERLAR
jgi:glyoxylase-like metal-dependent hydrolase (beta-lactamase superfamily II)